MCTEEFEQAKERVYGYILKDIAHKHVHKIEELIEKASELTETDFLAAVDDAFAITKDKFYGLLLSRDTKGRQDITIALDVVTTFPDFKGKQGLLFINRCFYSICNYLQTKAHYPYIIDHLRLIIEHLLDLPERGALDRGTRVLQQRMHDFRESSFVICLQRRIQLYDKRKTGKVSDIFHECPYLWGPTTCTPDIKELEKDLNRSGIGQKKYQKIHSDYLAINKYCIQHNQGISNLVIPVPWGSSPAEFVKEVIHFWPGKSGNYYTKARKFEQEFPVYQDFQSCRSIIRDYMRQACRNLQADVARRFQRAIDRVLARTGARSKPGTSIGESGKIKLFEEVLQEICLPELNETRVNEFQQCLKKTGYRAVTGVLLQLVLACPMARFKLEKILASLYEFLEEKSSKVVKWAMNFFQYMNLALTTNAEQLRYFELRFGVR